MEKEILNRLIKELEYFKKEQVLLLIILLLLFVLANIVQAVYTSRLIERYRNELKKKEIKFNALNELQLNKLSTLFELISNIKSGAAQIYNQNKKGSETHVIESSYPNSYKEFSNFCQKFRYAFPKNIKVSIQENTKLVSDLYFNTELLNEKRIGENNIAYSPENELHIQAIIHEIENYNFEREALNVMIFAEHLRNLIEAYFEKLE